MKAYTIKEVLLKTKLSKKTLNKYIQELEYQVYDFEYDSNEEIIFNEKDIDVINRIKRSLEQYRSANLTISEAVNLVMTDYDKTATGAEIASAVEYDIKDLTEPPISAIELVEKIGAEFNEMKYGIFQLSEKFNDFVDHQEKIVNILEKFEKGEASRDQVLMMSFRLQMDNKKQMEELEAKIDSKTFWGFFKKKKEKKQP